MLDPDNPKDSILDDLLWTESELKEIVRQAINKITTKMTFDNHQPPPVDSRWIRAKAIISCPGGNQPEVFAAIRKHLEGLHIMMMFDHTSSDEMLKIWFEVPRWRPFDDRPGETS
jgi:hypothetical protein